jgi:uncharacterized RDD family membrane protein YckC
MTLCTSCGGENADGARFCVKCGAGLSAAPSPGSWRAPSGDLYGTRIDNLNSQAYGGSADPSAGAYQAPPPYGAPYGSSPGSSYGSPAGAYGAPPQQQQQPSAYSSPNPYEQPQSNALYAPQQAPWLAPVQASLRADPGLRLVGYLIDILPWIVLISVISMIPFVGWIFAILLAPILTVSYILLRDFQGASLGKHLLGMRVIGKDGREATTGARILRNLPLAIPAMFTIIPILGYILGGLVGFVVVLTEVITILSTGERVGDKIAKTMVVKTK